ncbi:MAG: DUF1080 domain-containing protein [Bryobacter sp.]|nr:DUF1080 domain-containing protein [Bryobacter sp.]
MITRRSLFAAAFSRRLDLNKLSEWCAADGTDFPYSSWRFEKGQFHALGGLAVFQDIRTRRTFTDFEFHFKFRLAPAGNSGVKYLIDRADSFRGHIRARGREFQLIDDLGSPAADRPDHRCGALYNVQGPALPASFRAGSWATGKLVRRGASIEHWINGVCLLRHQLPASDASRSTPLALQNHHDDCLFRGLYVAPINT